jgi:hypothetical protein
VIIMVRVGSACIDENGQIAGGQSGNQSGRELRIEPWYLHSKGWVIYRANDPTVADKIAENMEFACKNMHIGYDQKQRGTLYSHVKSKGFDCSKVTDNVETDCSALTRVCICYAGILVSNFTTSSIHSVLSATGQFTKLTDSKHTTSSDYLKRGDVIVTRTKGHVVVCLDDGPKANNERQKVTGSPISQGICIDLEYANVREAPNGQIVGRVNAGEKVDIYAEENNQNLKYGP